MMPITITVITNLKNAVIEAPCLDDNNDSEVLTTSSSSIPKLKRRFSNSSCAEEKKKQQRNGRFSEVEVKIDKCVKRAIEKWRLTVSSS